MKKTPWYQPYFKNKKVTKMGLGPLGRSFGDIVFLAQAGARVLVTDYRDGEDLKKSKQALKKKLTSSEYKNLSFVFGKHRLTDFRSADFVLKASGVPLDSQYIAAAKKARVPVHTSSAWLFDLCKKEGVDVTTIGVTGTKGKSTVTDMIEHLLKTSGQKYHIAGNVRGVANLPVLKKVKSGDIILAELDSWQLQGFGDAKISPNISIFTNFFEDHLNYYKGSMKKYFSDKANIFKYQNAGDITFVSSQANKQISKYHTKKFVKKTVPRTTLPNWKLQVLGDHNRENAALAYSVGQRLGIKESVLKKALTTYKPMEGRLRYLGMFDEVHFYDDNNSTTPGSTLASLRAVSGRHAKKVIMLGGGADKEFDYSVFGKGINRYVSSVVLFEGAATNKIIDAVYKTFVPKMKVVSSMRDAFAEIRNVADKGDVVILSPGAASFGVFKNEYDRGDQFNKRVKQFKRK